MDIKSTLKTLILGSFFCSIPYFSHATPIAAGQPSILVSTLNANADFEHLVGRVGTKGWQVDYKRDRSGYILFRAHDPLFLEPGLHRFTFTLRRGNYPSKGLLHDSYGLFRLEVWDVTKREKLVDRDLQIADFPQPNRYVQRWVEFSTRGRKGHSFEPRIYWLGLANGEVERIEISRFKESSPSELEAKAFRLGDLLEQKFIENGFVVSRKKNGNPDETGDATTYTGWYAASLAWRYATTHDEASLGYLENALETLHNAIKGTYDRPILTRYVDENGQPFPKSPSKDLYTAFFFAYAAAAPHIKNPALKSQMVDDTRRLASRLIKENLSVREGQTEIMSLAPYFSENVVRDGIQKLVNDKSERQQFLHGLKVANAVIPFGEAWPGSKEVISAIKKRDEEKLFQLAVPTANGILDLAVRVRDLLREEYREDLFPKRTYLDYPGKKLETLVSKILNAFPVQHDGRRIHQISDLKVLGSNALIALEIIRSAYEITKNTQYLDYYRANLYSGDALLKTALDWDGFDEPLLRLTAGNPTADRERRGYLSDLALTTLISLEKNPAVKQSYVSLLDQSAHDYRHDNNPMVMALDDAATGKNLFGDFILRALEEYPENRHGFGRDYWNLYGRDVGNKLGGEAIKKYSAEPLPISNRPKDSFLWQRNARRLYGDQTNDYPTTDYLFLYWFSRYHKLIPEPEQKAQVSR